MVRELHVSRRQLLGGAAAAAGSVLLAACSKSKPSAEPKASGSTGSGTAGPSASPSPAAGGPGPSASPSGAVGDVTTPLPIPASFTEAPLVKQLMGGKYVPVSQRLPKNPYVVPHRWVEPGKYGGTLNTVVFSSSGADVASDMQFFYGFSPTRVLNDGLDIGPGSADKWSSNADASEWTVHFREGLKWSDGVGFDVDDVIFWYEDMALPGHDGLAVPVECISANGHPCKMTRVDQYTLKLTYDSPQPIVPECLTRGPKGGSYWATWIMPKHYLKQFHPKYNPNVPKNWDVPGGLWEQKEHWLRNPDCPTLIGYTCSKFDVNKGLTLTRNPYYYAVMPNGDQLPYIDHIVFDVVQDAQVIKLQVQQGKYDFCFGNFNQLSLADISTLSANKQKGGYNLLLWDSGSGTASIFFLNYDYIAKDKKYGEIFRKPEFRQAISHAYDRKTAQKTLYFETGQVTTGTMSSKAIEFHTEPSGPTLFGQWRDSYVSLDPAKAQQLFEKAGLKKGPNGVFTFSDGSPFTLSIPYSADIATVEAQKDDLLVANLKKVGLNAIRQPISPTAFGAQWSAGLLMSHTNWEVGDGPDCLVNPFWLVPVESARWAPLEGEWFALSGQPKQQEQLDVAPIKRNPPRMKPDANGPIQKLTDLYNKTKLEPDAMKRHQLVWQIFKVHISDGPFFMGTIENYPQLVVSSTHLKNVPEKANLAQHGFVNTFWTTTPGCYDTESWYWDDPSQHA